MRMKCVGCKVRVTIMIAYLCPEVNSSVTQISTITLPKPNYRRSCLSETDIRSKTDLRRKNVVKRKPLFIGEFL
jgi:hypothetical protein